MAETMQAIVIPSFGGPEVLTYKTVPKPVPQPGEALINIKAFGVNFAEMYMRKGEWDVWNPITGLECVGLIEACPSGEFQPGTKVVAAMGGMGRDRPGGYAEFVTVPTANVAAVDTDLPWEQLAALPEVYATAYSCVMTLLDVKEGETLLVRGATSTIGQAAVHLAVDAGAIVTATTRREARFAMLEEMGAKHAVKEQKDLATQLPTDQEFDKVLNLVGNSVLVESIALTKFHGRMLQAGWLGGLAPVVDFNPMVEMKTGVHFSLFHSKVLGTAAFPMSGIPLQDIANKIARGAWDAKPTHVFRWEEIQDAHRMLDSHDAGGKIVVKNY